MGALVRAAVLGKPLADYPDERWLDVRRRRKLAPALLGRLDLAVDKRCDAVDLDNVDGFTHDTGFPLTFQNQLDFDAWMANAARRRGLAVGLKNDLDQVEELVSYFDFAVNEQCFQYDECERLLPFVEAGKAVLGIEYRGRLAEFCPRANALNLDFLRKRLSLDAYRRSCR